MSRPARETEAPCAVTGKPCQWMSEDETDEAGEIVAWDLFCANCGRYRDWDKDEMPEHGAMCSGTRCRGGSPECEGHIIARMTAAEEAAAAQAELRAALDKAAEDYRAAMGGLWR